MKKLLLFALLLGTFALGVYVGQHPVADLLLRGAQPASRVDAPAQETVQSPERGGASESSAPEPVAIPTTQLSAGQRALLEKLGIDAASITITAEMIACAEAKLGAPRLAEIQGGATPTFTEGASLLACYR